jgi:hypothetical protein
MGGKSGGGGSAPISGPYDAQYLARYPDVAGFEQGPFAHYQQFGQTEGRQYGPDTSVGIEMPDLGGMMAAQQAQAAEAQAAYQAELAARAEAERREAGIKERDSLYSQYMNAAGSATDYINGEIDRERSNAALMGVEYNLTDEAKQQRVSDYFASVWGEGDQTQLESLFNQWGNPTGFTDFAIKRGDASVYATEQGGPDQTQAVTEGTKPKKTLVEEDETNNLGGATSILGGG